MELVPAEIDAAVTRLFTLLGVQPPRDGSVVLDFHEWHVQVVRPTAVIRIRRDKTLATDGRPAHTQQRTS